MKFESMPDFLNHLPAGARRAISWLFGAVVLLVMGYTAAMSTVTRQEFDGLNQRVEMNVQEIRRLRAAYAEARTVDRISLCMDVAALEGDEHRQCFFSDTRDRYLLENVDIDLQTAIDNVRVNGADTLYEIE